MVKKICYLGTPETPLDVVAEMDRPKKVRYCGAPDLGCKYTVAGECICENKCSWAVKVQKYSTEDLQLQYLIMVKQQNKEILELLHKKTK